MVQTFLRDYQEYAVSEVLDVFGQLDERRLARGEEIAIEKRITIIVSPTASGKTMIMKHIADRLSEQGYSTLVLTHLVTVANQCREAGLVTTTVQNLFSAFKAAAEAKQRGRKARLFAAKSIGVPESFFDNEIMILVDESHWAAENLAKIYLETISMTRARMVVGFTATPRWVGVFNTIDLSDQVKAHVAPPRKSIVYTHSLLTLPNQLSLYPVPGLIFTQGVAAAALITSAANILSRDGREAVLIVGNAKTSLELWVRNMFPRREAGAPQPAASKREGRSVTRFTEAQHQHQGNGRNGTEHHGLGAGLAGGPGSFLRPKKSDFSAFNSQATFTAVDYPHMDSDEAGESQDAVVLSFRSELSSAPTLVTVDRSERRLAIVTLLLVLDFLKKQGSTTARRELESIVMTFSGLPKAAESLRLIETYRPQLLAHYKSAMFGRGAKAEAALVALCQAVREMSLESASSPAPLAAGKYRWGVSVHKIATGLNLPELRTVCMGESITDSAVLYKQRAGRGARKMDGKPFYDLIDVVYFDPLSDSGAGEHRISWMNTLVDDPTIRMQLECQDLVFREAFGGDTPY